MGSDAAADLVHGLFFDLGGWLDALEICAMTVQASVDLLRQTFWLTCFVFRFVFWFHALVFSLVLVYFINLLVPAFWLDDDAPLGYLGYYTLWVVLAGVYQGMF